MFKIELKQCLSIDWNLCGDKAQGYLIRGRWYEEVDGGSNVDILRPLSHNVGNRNEAQNPNSRIRDTYTT